MFDVLGGVFADTRLESDLPDLLWSVVNTFHRKADRVQRELDDNEDRQRRAQQEQDGSEVKSVELERLIAEGLSHLERRNAFEILRDQAADLFEARTGSTWRPHAGSMVNHRHMTALLIDSRDFLAARRRAETEVLLPAVPRIAFAGGIDCNDTDRIWATLDRVRTKHPDMVLLHGGSPRGAERIAACWADSRKVPQVVFKPNWTRHAKRPRSSATTSCWRPCQSGSSSSPAAASARTSPTRQGPSAYRCGGSAGARKCPLSHRHQAPTPEQHCSRRGGGEAAARRAFGASRCARPPTPAAPRAPGLRDPLDSGPRPSRHEPVNQGQTSRHCQRRVAVPV